LGGVSCPTSTMCMAVGWQNEIWNGSTWQASPNPTDGDGSHATLLGVSCPSATQCVGVGEDYSSAAGAWEPIVESWNGQTWSIVPSPAFAQGAVLNAVSCGSPTTCMAVGAIGYNESLVETWDGTAWTQTSAPAPSQSVLDGVSCKSETCAAVGYSGGSGLQAVAATWDGSGWLSAPAVPGALFGVSCPEPGTCIAVGSDESTGAVLVETEGDSGWSTMAVANPSAAWAGLYGVTCGSPRSCTAVGTYLSHGGRFSLVEREG
ncbi:MAG TPA: hypothetical protein VE197_20360, partial [Mycobacterium sp.]|nr:hypothetical protein [Mycobacterium sp.]